MNALKRLLGLDGHEDDQEVEEHRKALRDALKKQHEAGKKAETTLVDMLTRSAQHRTIRD